MFRRKKEPSDEDYTNIKLFHDSLNQLKEIQKKFKIVSLSQAVRKCIENFYTRNIEIEDFKNKEVEARFNFIVSDLRKSAKHKNLLELKDILDKRTFIYISENYKDFDYSIFSVSSNQTLKRVKELDLPTGSFALYTCLNDQVILFLFDAPNKKCISFKDGFSLSGGEGSRAMTNSMMHLMKRDIPFRFIVIDKNPRDLEWINCHYESIIDEIRDLPTLFQKESIYEILSNLHEIYIELTYFKFPLSKLKNKQHLKHLEIFENKLKKHYDSLKRLYDKYK